MKTRFPAAGESHIGNALRDKELGDRVKPSFHIFAGSLLWLWLSSGGSSWPERLRQGILHDRWRNNGTLCLMWGSCPHNINETAALSDDCPCGPYMLAQDLGWSMKVPGAEEFYSVPADTLYCRWLILFMSRSFRKPSLSDALLLLLQFKYAPEGWEGGYAHDGGEGRVADHQWYSPEYEACEQEDPPATGSEVVFRLDHNRVEYSDYKKGCKSCDYACEVHSLMY